MQRRLDTRPLKMGSTGSPETSILNQPMLNDILEDGIIQVNRSKSLRSRRIPGNEKTWY